MEKKFEKFAKSDFGLEIWSKEKLIFRSKKEGIKGLLEFINRASIYGSESKNIRSSLPFAAIRVGEEENGVLFAKKSKRFPKNLTVFDKKVGNAVALISVYIGGKEVFGVVGSKSAKKTFKNFKIKYHFLKTIPKILNKKGTDICPLEKLSRSKTPIAFLKLAQKKSFPTQVC